MSRSPTMSREQAIEAIKRLKLRPGTPAPASGQYTMRLRDRRRQCTMVKGRRLPASPPGSTGFYWQLTDPTHRAKRRR